MGRTVECVVSEVELENERGYTQSGVRAVCTNCGHTTESFGTGDASRKRCLVLMREECPLGECNFYVEE